MNTTPKTAVSPEKSVRALFGGQPDPAEKPCQKSQLSRPSGSPFSSVPAAESIRAASARVTVSAMAALPKRCV